MAAQYEIKLGVRFTERDVKTKALIDKVRRALNYAITNVSLKKLKARLGELRLTAVQVLPNKELSQIYKRLSDTIKRVSITYGPQNINLDFLPDYLKKQLSIGLREGIQQMRADIKTLMSSWRASMQKLFSKKYIISTQIQLKRGDIRAQLSAINKDIATAAAGYRLRIPVKPIISKKQFSDLKLVAKVPVEFPHKELRKAHKNLQKFMDSQPPIKLRADLTISKRIADQLRRELGLVARDAAALRKQFSHALPAKPIRRAVERLKEVRAQLAAIPTQRRLNLVLSPRDVELARYKDNLNKIYSEAGMSAAEFGAKIGQIAKRFSAFFVYTAGLFKMLEAIRQAVDGLRLLDDTAKSLAKVLPGVDTEQLTDRLVDMAIQTGRTFAEVSDAATNFARQGLKNIDEIAAATRATMQLLNISTVDAVTGSKLLITTVNAFGITFQKAAKYVAMFSDLADNSAVTVEDLAKGFIRSGATASAFGVSIEELGAMIATVAGTTQLAATRVGTAMKTILVSIAQNREEIIKLAKNTLRLAGDTEAASREYKTTSEIIELMAQAWQYMDETQRAAMARLAGGKRRFTELSALLSRSDKYHRLLAIATEASTSALRKEAIEAQTVGYAHRQLVNAIVKLVTTLKEIGAVDVYRKLILGASSLLVHIVDLGKAWDKFLTKKLALEVDTSEVEKVKTIGEMIAESIGKGVTNAASVLQLLKRTILVIFGKVFIPQIITAARHFRAFITGSETQIRALVDGFNQVTRAVEQSTIAIQQQNAALKQTGMLADALTKQRMGVAPAVAMGGVGPGVRQVRASNVAMQQMARSMQKAAGGARDFAKEVGRALVIMTALESIGNVIGTFGDEIVKTGNTLEQTGGYLLSFGGAAAKGAAFLAPLGPAAAAVGAALSTVAAVINRTSEALKAREKLATEEERTAAELVDAQAVLAKARSVEALRIGLVNKGYARLVQTFASGKLGEEFISRLALPRKVNVKLILTAGAGELARNLDKSFQSLVQISKQMQDLNTIFNRVTERTQFFRQLLSDLAKERLQVVVDFVEKNYGPVNRDLINLGALIEDITREGFTIEFTGVTETGDQTVGAIKDIGTQLAYFNDLLKFSTTQTIDFNSALEGLQSASNRAFTNFRNMVTATYGLRDAFVELPGEIDNITSVGIKALEDGLNSLQREFQETVAYMRDQATGIEEAKEALEEFAKAHPEFAKEIVKAIESSVTKIKLLDEAEKLSGEVARRAEEMKQRALEQTARRWRDMYGQLFKLLETAAIKARTTTEQFIIEVNRLQSALMLRDIELGIQNLDAVIRAQDDLAQATAVTFAKIAKIDADFAEKRAKLIDFQKEKIEELKQKLGEAATPYVQAFELQLKATVALEFKKSVEQQINALYDLIIKNIQRAKKAEQDRRQAERAIEQERKRLTREIESINIRKLGDLSSKINTTADKIAGLRNSLLDLDKTIAKLQAQIAWTPPPRLAKKVARLPELETKAKQLREEIALVRAFEEHNQRIREINDATINLNYENQKYLIGIKRQLGIYRTWQDQIDAITASYDAAVNGIAASEEAIYRIRADLNQQIINVLQDQFNSIKRFGEGLYTANYSRLAKIALAMQYINRDLSEVPLFLRDTVVELLKLQRGPGIEIEIAKAGLERIGIDTTALERLNEEIIRKSAEVADLNKKAFDAQQRTANSTGMMVNLLEQELSQTEKQIQEAQQAREKIDELRQAAFNQEQTLEQQLSEALERRKLLQAQLNQQLSFQANLQNQFMQLYNVLQEGSASAKFQAGKIAENTVGVTAVQSKMDEVTLAVLKSAETVAENKKIIEQSNAIIADSKKTVEELHDRIESLKQALIEKQAELISLQNTLIGTNQDITNTIADGTNVLLKSISTSVDFIRQNLPGWISKLITAINNVRIRIYRVAGTQTRAGGLSPAELFSLKMAAEREKREMPRGSELVVANTSELILTKDQAKKIFGQLNLPDKLQNTMAQVVNAPIRKEIIKEKTIETTDFRSLINRVEQLIEKINNKVKEKPEQKINISLDGRREIHISGINELSSEIERIWQRNMKQAVSRAEFTALKSTLLNILQRLKEMGVDGV